MREYLLYSQIPQARENQILSILAGVTSAQPIHEWQQVIIYGQLKKPEVAVSRKNLGKPQTQKQIPELHYHKLIRNIKVDGSGEAEPGPWIFRAEALPDPGITEFISRTVEEHPPTADDLQRVQQPDWYRYRRQLLIETKRFVQNNVVIRLFRILHTPETPDPLSSPAPSPIEQRLVDVSGSWIIEVSIRVEDGNNSTLTDKAKKELLTFKESMDGAVDLIAPDRLALDTRVKNANP